MFDTITLSSLPPDAEAIRPRVRALIEEHVLHLPLHERVRTWLGADAGFSRAMGEAGLLGLTLPTEYGGHGLGAFARFVVVEELLAAGAPVGAHWVADRQSAPLILKFGTEAQKQKYVPPICRGEAYYCIGMSEPGSGSDLASVRTSATRTERGTWLVNGQKVWTSYAHQCDYMIALLRTSGGPENRQAGLSQLLIDLKAPGITIRPIRDLNGDEDFNEVFFDNVELPGDVLIGQEGAGWDQVTAELAFERSGPERIYSSALLLDAWIKAIGKAGADSEQRLMLAGSFTAQLAALRELSIAVTARLVVGESPVVEASLLKDLGTSLEQAIPLAIADDLAGRPDEPVDPELMRALKVMLHITPAYSLRGGTREIIRGIIARGLGLR
jgi:alkylation response protein AidB-like acyl-CoA dehydrogenase